MLALRTSRGRIVAGLVALVVLAGVLLGVRALTGDDGSGSTASSASKPSASPTPDAKPTTLPSKVPTRAPSLSVPEKKAATAASGSLTTFLHSSYTALAANDGKANGVSDDAAGPALGEIQAIAAQYKNEGMTITGTPKVRASRVVATDLATTPPTVTLAVCLDNRPVTVRDAKGRSLTKHRTRSEQIVLNLYQVQHLDGHWLVVNHSIPANSSCKQMKTSS